MSRWPDLDRDAIREANRKQAVVPLGATVLDPVGTAPGLVVPPASRIRPDRRRSARAAARAPADVGDGASDRGVSRRDRRRHVLSARIVRLFGIPESEIANTLRALRKRASRWSELEITTCLRRGEIEVATRYEPPGESAYDAFVDSSLAPWRQLFSLDGSTIDEQVASLLGSRMVAVAESCTGGLMSARLTDAPDPRPTSRAAVVYSNEAKVSLAGVDPDLIDPLRSGLDRGRRGAGCGRRERFDADDRSRDHRDRRSRRRHRGKAGRARSASRSADPTVRASPAARGSPASRSDVRDRSTTVAMHLLRRVLVEGQATVPEEGARAERA